MTSSTFHLEKAHSAVFLQHNFFIGQFSRLVTSCVSCIAAQDSCQEKSGLLSDDGSVQTQWFNVSEKYDDFLFFL